MDGRKQQHYFPFYKIFNGLSDSTSFQRRLLLSFLFIAIPVISGVLVIAFFIIQFSTARDGDPDPGHRAGKDLCPAGIHFQRHRKYVPGADLQLLGTGISGCGQRISRLSGRYGRFLFYQRTDPEPRIHQQYCADHEGPHHLLHGKRLLRPGRVPEHPRKMVVPAADRA